ncbi:MAG: response regulator [Exilispira sp.]|jgi:signal transduction histidine kinase/two-component SAPR family response regulator|nr:response regulator [Exilispira sp.]
MNKILIIDDYEENRYLLRNYLEAENFIVFEAKNGIEALHILRNEKIDLMISDILMPQMDGFTLCKTVKEDEKLKNTAFIFYTATYTEPADEKLALSLGASRFILKPKEKDEFIKIIKEVIEQYARGELETQKPQKIHEIEDSNYYKLYNEVLIRKLESKMIQLENLNKELENNFNYFLRIMDEIKEPMVILNSDYYIKEANQKFCEVFGPKDKIIDKNFFDFNEEYFETKDLKLLLEDLSKDNFILENYEIEIDRNYLIRTYNMKATKIQSKNQLDFDILILMEDITEMKKLLKEKEIAYNSLIQYEKVDSIGKFAGGIAHDFNNILTVIINSSQMILDSIDKKAELYEDAKNIYDAAIRGSELTKKILLFSKRKETKAEIIDIHKEINDIDKIAKRLIGENIKIEYFLNANETKVYMDPINFHQVLINLYSNAKDAMPSGGKIIVTTQNKDYESEQNEGIFSGKYIKIEIIDTGVGIDKDTLPKIFEPFFTTKIEDKGTGLGLYLVSSIIQQANGKAYVLSEENKGTTFILLLPTLNRTMEEQVKGFEVNTSIKIENILIIEDDPIVILSIEKILSRIGKTVKKVKTAKEALKLIEEGFSPDLIVSDIILEDMSINTLSRLIKKKIESAKILYISGYSKDEIIKHIAMVDDLNFIQKPFTLIQLQQKIFDLFSKN